MRQWLILTAIGAVAYHSACGQSDGSFSGTTYDLDSGRINVINGTYTAPKPSVRDETIANYRRMNAELEQSINHQREMSELSRQTREMREQTRLLEKMAQDKSRSTASHAPLAPSEKLSKAPLPRPGSYAIGPQDPLLIARFAQNFDPQTDRPIKQRFEGFSGQLSSNEQFTKRLVGNYAGEFTDYRWRQEKIDSQTYLVVCEASLDGKVYDFRFKVNTEIGSCRYEGGSALEKLAPAPASKQAPSPPQPVSGKPTSVSGGKEWWKEEGELVEDSIPKDKATESWGENDPLAE